MKRQAAKLDYDQLADEYARHRQVHPGVLQALYGATSGDSRVLEVGCGTGNYILALSARTGCAGWGIDPSARMLDVARARSTAVQFQLGDAHRLALPDASLDLVFSVDVIHHLQDPLAYLREAYRLLIPGGRLCTATDSPWVIRHREPLATHFPETVEADLARYPTVEGLRALYQQAGFPEIADRQVELRYSLTDIQAYRDRAFSVLHLIPEKAFQRGIARLERDLCAGPIPSVSRYTLLWATKPEAACRPCQVSL